MTQLAKTKEKRFLFLFILIMIVELFLGSNPAYSTFHYFSKPLIVISLLLFFAQNSHHVNKKTKRLMFLALIMSLVGDIALLFESKGELFFIAGLGSFLLAHIMYVLVFVKDKDAKAKNKVFLITTLLYGSILFYVLKGNLKELLIPVLIYMIVILIMANTAYIRKKEEAKVSYKYVLIGAIFFMLSDSLLAINMFYKPIYMSSILIMSTYGVAQLMIVLGILKKKN